MKKVALIGMPLAHTVSPAMHAAAFQAAGLDWVYLKMETNASELPEVVAQLRDPGWVGANVTVPYKERVPAMLDEIEPQARVVGAVNTIINQRGVLKGLNTDVSGFLNDLTRHLPVIAGVKAAVLGAGGGARAAVFALAQAGAEVQVLCRRVSQGYELARNFRGVGREEIHVRGWTREAFASIEAGTLIVNATPLGMWPQVGESPWMEGVPLPQAALVYDLVYNPPNTRLLQQSESAGVNTSNGLGMLVEQGAVAFELWTGRSAPRRVMRSAAEGALVTGYA